jgi:NADPH:quinone reductase-like Zn-dependent oxidoreductase
VRQQGRPFLSVANNKDLEALKQLIESGKVMPVIDRTYPLSATPEALGYIGRRHARGKVVITI